MIINQKNTYKRPIGRNNEITQYLKESLTFLKTINFLSNNKFYCIDGQTINGSEVSCSK